ncbi:hypothetical protein [Thalassobius sp. I31.1]|uniref:hypothetical protein n=1 Tax=Thalassobius sp. I31.1 TaxID=2109912 RepID=UPI00130092B2|nr:hypothetical protein [Thalassobius sp. I31.1]
MRIRSGLFYSLLLIVFPAIGSAESLNIQYSLGSNCTFAAYTEHSDASSELYGVMVPHFCHFELDEKTLIDPFAFQETERADLNSPYAVIYADARRGGQISHIFYHPGLVRFEDGTIRETDDQSAEEIQRIFENAVQTSNCDPLTDQLICEYNNKHHGLNNICVDE